MITPDEIRHKAERRYTAFLQAWLRGEIFFPLSFRAGVPPKDFQRLQREVSVLKTHSLEKRSTGYKLEYQTKYSQYHGTQTIPYHIVFEDADRFLHYLGKTAEFCNFQEDIEIIRATFPKLEDWLLENISQVIAYHGKWADLLKVCSYFMSNPRPNLYARELPIEVHTKFIETHTMILGSLFTVLLPEQPAIEGERNFYKRYQLRAKESLIRFRFLDRQAQQRTNIPFDDLCLPVSSLATYPLEIENCIITENEINFLTLPPLINTFAIWGGGFRVELLQQIEWLETCHLYYWGDIDAQGFEILSKLRNLFPEVASVMMDESTLKAFNQYAHSGTPSSLKMLSGLTLEERFLYEKLVDQSLRLEQEHIPQAYVISVLKRKGL